MKHGILDFQAEKNNDKWKHVYGGTEWHCSLTIWYLYRSLGELKDAVV